MLRRHPWIFSGAVSRIDGVPEAGESVQIISSDGTPLGTGAFSPESQIRVRMWSFDPAIAVDDAFVSDRIARAVGARAVFLGDGLSEWETVSAELRRERPHTVWHAVRGNNDWGRDAPKALCFSVNGVTFYACHGHEWQVKHGSYRVEAAAREQGARVALFGHTHCSCLEPDAAVTLVNPGAVCDFSAHRPLYAEILVDDDGRVRAGLVFS